MITFLAFLACTLWISNDDLCGEGVDRQHYYLDADGDGYGDPAADGGCLYQDRYVPNADDCDDADATIVPLMYRDSDGDGWGDSSDLLYGCTLEEGYTWESADCDDADAETGGPLWYRDADDDGDGAGDAVRATCRRPAGFVDNNRDCDDTTPLRNSSTIWYYNGDNDGYGLSGDSQSSCEAPEGYGAFVGGDCDDLNPTFSLQCPFTSVVVGGVEDADYRLLYEPVRQASHACALRSNGTAFCWGADNEGQASPPAGTRWQKLAAGALHSCRISAYDGSVQCWGRDDSGEVSGTPDGKYYTELVSGSFFSCVLDSDGTPTCWGNAADISDVPSGPFSALTTGLRGGLRPCGGRYGGVLGADVGLRPDGDLYRN